MSKVGFLIDKIKIYNDKNNITHFKINFFDKKSKNFLNNDSLCGTIQQNKVIEKEYNSNITCKKCLMIKKKLNL